MDRTLGLYFDYAAATPLDPQVKEAMQPFFDVQFFNPSAQYEPARLVHGALEDARRSVAHEIGSKPVEVIFTAGGTEANNLAIHGIMSRFPDAEMVYSAVEHDSVRYPASKYDALECPVDDKGIINIDSLKAKITDRTVLVSVMYANNEIGTIQPIREISLMITEIRRQRKQAGIELPILLHTDAAQAGNTLDLHVARLGVDMMTLNGGKIYGPKQSGVLYVRSGVVLEPILQGGGQERGMRSGTENVGACVGLALSLKRASELRQTERDRLLALQHVFHRELNQQLPQAILNGSKKHRLPSNVHITLPGQDNERLLILLDQAGISAAVGSACSASHDEPSHVLSAIGLSKDDIRGSLRFSMGRLTTEESIKKLVDILSASLA
jgi:cysteine desulfurase